ncbi:MAG: hypothetical protein ACXWO2_11375 [Candidatus Limnocylindrales bacterium]
MLLAAIYRSGEDPAAALASARVLHMPEPGDVVRARLGEERAEALMAEGAKLSIEEAIELALVE